MRGFTLLEIIFVIIVAGILTFIGFEYLPDNTLISDYQMLKQKILQKKFNALGYRIYEGNNLTCFECNKDWLNKDENSSKIKYVFKSEISCTNGVNKICFDYLGRDYNGSVDKNLTNLLSDFIIVRLNYKNEEKNITIYPYTGAIK